VILSGWAELSWADVEGEADSAELQAFCDKVTWFTWQIWCPADVQLRILVVQMWTLNGATKLGVFLFLVLKTV